MFGVRRWVSSPTPYGWPLRHRVSSPLGRSGAARNADTTVRPGWTASNTRRRTATSSWQISLRVTRSGTSTLTTSAAVVTARPV
ncbi:hypothetical protein [Micromonospora tarensis]|uniref:Uncharacterized protein n=1 Tax=Micromonospora tarensis TaxID=2806100 RepID=A0ABS1YAY9_9ACTN|nr:hypothetical protein [Micromonospora tarensis]MBM0274563.1 hypothetical protein [Micromonospora tarensis]